MRLMHRGALPSAGMPEEVVSLSAGSPRLARLAGGGANAVTVVCGLTDAHLPPRFECGRAVRWLWGEGCRDLESRAPSAANVIQVGEMSTSWVWEGTGARENSTS
jgi:hypothetical protein